MSARLCKHVCLPVTLAHLRVSCVLNVSGKVAFAINPHFSVGVNPLAGEDGKHMANSSGEKKFFLHFRFFRKKIFYTSGVFFCFKFLV